MVVFLRKFFHLRIFLRRRDMATFTIEPYVVDADRVELWKKAWLELWKKEKIKPRVFHLRADSQWVMEDTDIPYCPFHLNYCLLDESLINIKDWTH